MDRLNDEQKAFLLSAFEKELSQQGGVQELLRTGGAMPLDQHRKYNEGAATLSMDKETRELVGSLNAVLRSTKQSSEIVRKLLAKAGTDCDKNDSDPCGDGDQTIVKNESQAQVLRHLFAAGGDLQLWLLEYPLGMSSLSPFVWMCIMGDAKGVENALKNTPLEDRRELLEKRATSMRFPLLILVIAVSKHPQTVHQYTSRPIDQMDHLGVVRVLLQYGARPNAQEATGKTGKFLFLNRLALLVLRAHYCVPFSLSLSLVLPLNLSLPLRCWLARHKRDAANDGLGNQSDRDLCLCVEASVPGWTQQGAVQRSRGHPRRLCCRNWATRLSS